MDTIRKVHILLMVLNDSVVNQEQINDSYGIPHIYGGGLAWKYKKKLTVEADYTLQKWSGVKYNNRTDLYQDSIQSSYWSRVFT